MRPDQKIIDQIKSVLGSEPGIKLALLYGSAASGSMRPDSDVDVAVLFDAPMDAEKKMMLLSRLELALSREVDLIDLFSLSGTILKQVLCKGWVLIKTPSAWVNLVRRMLYNQQDMMPYVTRTLIERQRKFIDG